MSSKYALLIANTEYTDPGLAQWTAPGMDTSIKSDFIRDAMDQSRIEFHAASRVG